MNLPKVNNAIRTLTLLTATILLVNQTVSLTAAQTQTPAKPAASTKTANPIRSFMDWSKSLVTPTSHEKPAFNLTPNPGVAKPSTGSAPKPAIGAAIKPAVTPAMVPAAGKVSPISHLAAPRTSIIELGPADNLAEIVAKTRGPVVIDFHASWCGPCKTQGKVLKELDPYATQNGAAIVKIDVDKHPELAKKLNISSLPTLMVIKNGALVETKIGSVGREKIAGYLTPDKK